MSEPSELRDGRPDRNASPDTADGGRPERVLTAFDAAVLVGGVVLGVGVFRSPPVVATNVGDPAVYLGLWVLGGAISLLGALCYAELGTAYPDAGGEYHLVTRAYGPPTGFLVAWSRMTVIQTGSIAILAFVFGDYVADLAGLGWPASPVLAGTVVVALTAVNVAGIHPGRWTQHLLTGGAVAGMSAVVVAGFLLAGGSGAPASPAGPATNGEGSVGLALVFVLLAYGGWSEGAYLSAEVRNRTRGVGRALLWGLGGVTLLYVAVNAAYLAGLGMDGTAVSDAVAAEILRRALGSDVARAGGAAVLLAALSSANATIITGARSNYALGRDWHLFRRLGRWDGDRRTPVNALLVQAAIALALVGFGTVRRSGFEAMVAYTAPVFWLVLLATGAAVFVLRRREPDVERPFRVPGYPVTPALFCAAAAYMTWASIRYAGTGALLGLAVLAAGLPFLWKEVSERTT